MSTLIQQVINGIALGSIYALIGLGYTMVYGVLRMINFAHGELVILGPIVALFMLRAMGFIAGPLSSTLAVPLTGIKLVAVALLILLGAGAFSGTLGVMMERLAYRPLRRAPLLTPLLSALGVSIFLQNVAMLASGRAARGFPDFLTIRYFQVMGASFSSSHLFIMIICATLLMSLQYLVQKTYVGRCFRAVAEDKDIASLMGVDVNRTIVLVFTLGPLIGAISGVLFSMHYGRVDYSMSSFMGMKGWIAAVSGGIGSILGTAAGGLLLGIIEAISAGYLPTVSRGVLGAEYKDIIAFIILIIMLIFRPQGLFGEAVKTK